MRDLELRGAGNLLGPQQSGHIAAIGFELYCQLLKQSIATLRGEKVKPRIEVALRLDFLSFGPVPAPAPLASPTHASSAASEPSLRIEIPREVAVWKGLESDQPEAADQAPEDKVRHAAAYLPANFVSEPQHRIEIHRKLAQSSDKDGLDAVWNEVRDRFGPLPAPVELLFLANELRIIGASKRIVAIETKGDRLMLQGHKDWIMPGGKHPRLTRREPKERLAEIKQLLLTLGEHG